MLQGEFLLRSRDERETRPYIGLQMVSLEEEKKKKKKKKEEKKKEKKKEKENKKEKKNPSTPTPHVKGSGHL